MELGSIVQFLENRTILVTGATGFLAKSTCSFSLYIFIFMISCYGFHNYGNIAVFVEKILRAQPNVKKLYLLLRAPDSKAALQRLNTEVLAIISSSPSHLA